MILSGIRMESRDQNKIKGSEWNQGIRINSRDQNGIKGSEWNQRIRMESGNQNGIKGSRWPLNFNRSKTLRKHSYHSVLWTTVNHVIKNFGRIKWSSTMFFQSRLLIPHHPSRQSTVNIWLPLNLVSLSLSGPSHNSVFDSLETRLTWY